MSNNVFWKAVDYLLCGGTIEDELPVLLHGAYAPYHLEFIDFKNQKVVCRGCVTRDSEYFIADLSHCGWDTFPLSASCHRIQPVIPLPPCCRPCLDAVRQKWADHAHFREYMETAPYPLVELYGRDLGPMVRAYIFI